MKILHVCLANFYIDNYSYQENILPREHKKMGYDVKILASTETFIDNNNLGYVQPRTYFNEDEIEVTRLDYRYKFLGYFSKKIRAYKGVKNYLENYKPDIIFLHDTQFKDIKHIVEYIKKYPEVKLFSDCHADFSNSARNFLSRYFLHGIIYKKWTRKILDYNEVFWGVLPSRVDFLKEVYKIPENKTGFLPMGAETDLIKSANSEFIKNKFQIKDKDFLIVTGGKIDKFKLQTINLMKIINEIGNSNVKLLVFGSVSEEIKNDFNKQLSDNVIYAGWIDSEASYSFFKAANLVVFPGRHSVFWEQVVAQGKPMLIKYWDGLDHLDFNGNLMYLREDSEDELFTKLNKIIRNKNIYERMSLKAQSDKRKEFYYHNIAKKSINIK